MKKLLAIALLISMGPLCAMEAGDSAEKQWALEEADSIQIAAVGQLVVARGNTGEEVGYWLAQLASFHNGCTNGDLRAFEVYFENKQEFQCKDYFNVTYPVAPAAFSPVLSASSPPSPAPSGGGVRKPLRHSGKDRKLLGLSKLQYLTAMGGTAMVAGGVLAARRHIKVRHAKGEKTVFDRMGQWIQRRYRRLVRNKKTTSETNA